MKKKKFNLEDALKGEAVYRNGVLVRVIHIPERKEAPVMVVCAAGNMDCDYNAHGTHLHVSSYDLYMAPKKVVRWLNFYEHGVAYYYSTKEEAESMSTSDAIAVAVRAEWEE